MTTETTAPFPGLTSEVLDHGTHRGIDWQVHMGPFTINGYCRIPEDHPWHGEDLMLTPKIDVHGGITFDKVGTIGFDTNHYCDGAHPAAPKCSPDVTQYMVGHVWTRDEVRAETLRMADQIADSMEEA